MNGWWLRDFSLIRLILSKFLPFDERLLGIHFIHACTCALGTFYELKKKKKKGKNSMDWQIYGFIISQKAGYEALSGLRILLRRLIFSFFFFFFWPSVLFVQAVNDGELRIRYRQQCQSKRKKGISVNGQIGRKSDR